MNEQVIKDLEVTLGISNKQIKATLKLLNEGSTIPFISRYRKEATGNLDENQIKAIADKYDYFNKLLTRKEDVIRLIDEKGLLTDNLKEDILACQKLTEVEDLYRPFKEKKKTKASEAIKLGLTPLAKKIMSFPLTGDIKSLITIPNIEPDKALEGALYIIAEWFSDNAYIRKNIRRMIYNECFIKSKLKQKAKDETKTYEMYYDFQERVKYIKPYRVLAINRGEKEGILSVSLDYDMSSIETFIKKTVIKNPSSFVVSHVEFAIKDALKRLILPSIEREIRSEITEMASENAIEIFKVNLENLLMTRPLKGYRVMGFDPAFRTGCKLACLNESGTLLHIDVIYPHEPKKDYINSKEKLLKLIDEYNINLIAIGNGTASRESEEFVASVIKDLTGVKYTIVSEAGASVYSASKKAQEEFPNLEVQERSAISIGRRVIDPMSELVKISPESIGVGEYQHDVNQGSLKENLDFVVTKVVNEVGVDINTANPYILKYISGLTNSLINKIMIYKEKKHINKREDLLTIGLSKKAYEQSVGFLRIKDGINPLDNTGIHPESYNLTNKILEFLKLDINNSSKEEFKNILNNVSIEELCQEFKTDKYTISDIIKELMNPGIDPRDEVMPPILRSDVLTLEDLKPNMKLKGTIRNVASFGAFVDIGLKNDCLLHISKISKEFVKNPTDVLSVGSIVDVYIDSIDLEKHKASLRMFE